MVLAEGGKYVPHEVFVRRYESARCDSRDRGWRVNDFPCVSRLDSWQCGCDADGFIDVATTFDDYSAELSIPR